MVTSVAGGHGISIPAQRKPESAYGETALADENYFLRARVERLEHALTDTKPLPVEWRLTATEAAVFAVMVNRELATREAIMAASHRDPTKDEPLPKSVDVYVYKLRQKLGPHGVTIATVFVAGYRLAPATRERFRTARASEQMRGTIYG